MSQKRCGRCAACLYLAATRKICLAEANPPFSHADSEMVKMWNTALVDNPCIELMTTGQHAEAWWLEQGHFEVPARGTSAWQEMYEKWHAFAFADFCKE